MVAYLQAALWWGLPLVGPPLQGLQSPDHGCLPADCPVVGPPPCWPPSPGSPASPPPSPSWRSPLSGSPGCSSSTYLVPVIYSPPQIGQKGGTEYDF